MSWCEKWGNGQMGSGSGVLDGEGAYSVGKLIWLTTLYLCLTDSNWC